MKTLSTDQAQLCEFLTRMESDLKADIDHVMAVSHKIIREDKAMPALTKDHFSWNLTHIIDNMITITRDMRRHCKILEEDMDAD